MLYVSLSGIREGESQLPGEMQADDMAQATEYLASIVLSRRVYLLRESDWTQLTDSPLTALERTSWSVYRQALRDLPNTPGFPACQWPVAPAVGQDDSGGPGGHL